jgi:[ribosomal protein S18]-alanine N-acetyltransferase
VSYYLEPMRLDDVNDVSRVERECFSNPWPQSAYRRELRNAGNNHYIVLRERADIDLSQRERNDARRADSRRPLGLLPFVRRPEPPPLDTAGDPIIGFAGMWVLFDEAHVTTIGVLPNQRGKGLGELMLVELFEQAQARGAEWLTLEVRVSNAPAQALYEKYGFTRQGVRRRYYSDNGEDAYIMWSPSLRTASFRDQLARLKATLLERFGAELLERPVAHGGEAAS